MENELLISKTIAGDPDAYAELMQLYLKDMYRVAYAILMNDDDTADAIQDTYLACWEKIRKLNHAEYFKTWLIRILINCCYSIRRSHRNCFPTEDIEVTSVNTEDHLENIDLKYALLSLDEKYRLPLVMHYFEGYSADEIAKIIKIPRNTVYTRLKRGREQLKEILK